MYKKVLVPYDKSEPAKNALQAAIDLVSEVPGGEITVLSVVDWHDFNAETFKIASRMSGVMGDTMDMEVISEVESEAIKADMDAIAENIEPLVGDVDGVGIAVVNGSPHDSITAYADEGDYDCIVMGHRGLGAVRGMLGSVCYSVLHKTNIPVLIVK
ncbi:universal stress protein [Adlercreutzia sp. R25]|uniref:Universal stress protein n=1 Tax=Adlercreutzia shanghongiae TaxID=3111773 RepID=A0ABU6IVL0_9ACTN|nr:MULTISPECIES: universal stress protein [unclassified Adlercreutzia]MEC4272148.1 universal stress protein [Adlercreutzia sp. R25]MEC4293869.1 universal stress protein [Adlercreutzia sp. R22]